LRALPTTGHVFIDHREAERTNLDALRRAITIIPQNPELLEGSLRENLDPLREHDDAELNAVLKASGLTQYGIEEGKDTNSHRVALDTRVEGSGSNFSQGQRQIIALARALVRRNKILIMDEATSAIGQESILRKQPFANAAQTTK
jgi:ABC-type multidrug transport system fused ATPase/permease subunit